MHISPGHAQRRKGTYNPAPAGTLNSSSGRVELLLEVVDGSPSLEDRLLERSILEVTTVALALRLGRREVLPEEGVVDMTCAAAIPRIR